MQSLRAQVVQYLPNFFFAALLMLLGVEITLDWLILSVRKVSRAEYCLLLASFLAILQRESAALQHFLASTKPKADLEGVLGVLVTHFAVICLIVKI